MLQALRQFINDMAKFFAGIFVKAKVEPTPEPAPQPVPSPSPSPSPSPVPPPPDSSGTGTKPTRTTPWLMRDSTNGFDIPVGTEVVAYYVDGLYKWSAPELEHHKNSIRLGIAVSSNTNDGSILDVERGDASPDQAPGWVEMRRHAGRDPWVYMNESTWPSVRRAFQSRHVKEPHYWVARWSADHTIPNQATALQYANPTLTHAHYDESHIIPSWTSKQS